MIKSGHTKVYMVGNKKKQIEEANDKVEKNLQNLKSVNKKKNLAPNEFPKTT